MELILDSYEDFGTVRVLRLVGNPVCPLHQAGHFAVLQFSDFEPRPYSIANAPNGQYLEFHIKNSGQAGASEYAAKHLKIGDKILCSKIDGNYTYNPPCNRPLALIAGGTGLSPMLAIMEASLLHSPVRPIYLFYGGRTLSDLYFHSRLENLAQQNSNIFYSPALSEEKSDGIQHGLIGDIAFQHPEILKSRIYIAGSVDMVRDIITEALATGVSPDVIHSDYKELHSIK